MDPLFTKVMLSLCNKKLLIQITLQKLVQTKVQTDERGCFLDCAEPFEFTLIIPDFHRPSTLDFTITSTAKDFRNIFSKGLLDIFLLLKLTKEDWKKLINEYECYLAEKEKRMGSSSGSSPTDSLKYSEQHEPSSDSRSSSQQVQKTQFTTQCSSVKSDEKFVVGELQTTDQQTEVNSPDLEDKLLLHTFYHATHPKMSSPCNCSKLESCDEKLNESYVVKFQNYIEYAKECLCYDNEEKLCPKCNEYWGYVKEHLQNDNCPLKCCPLWKLCVKKQQYEFCKSCGPEGLVLLSQNADKTGTVQADYFDFSKQKFHGGHKRVFHVLQRELRREIAVKEAVANAPKMDAKQFKLMWHLNHNNVIKIEECVLGQKKRNEETTPYLFVMPFINKRGLNEQFSVNNISIVDYLCNNPKLGDRILLNYIHIMSDVYEGLQYFAKKNLIHGDIKRSNILVEQLCNCSTVIECDCSSKCFTAKLADFDFIKKATQLQDGTWARPLPYMLGGTVGMQAPETYFQDSYGNLVLTPKADMWSASITMIHGFHRRVDKDDQALKMINEFCKDISNGLHQCHEDCDKGIEMLQQLDDSIKSDDEQDDECIKKRIKEIIKKFEDVRNNMINQCNFQSGLHPFKEDKKTSSMADIMTPVHIAHTMPQTCLKRLPDIFQSKKCQQRAIQKVWEVIQDGLHGRNIDNEGPAINVRDDVTTKEAHAQQVSNDSKVDEVDAYAQMEEEPTILPSTRTVVTDGSTLILDHQVNRYTTDVHSQDHSGSQSVSETVPTEAQDSGNQEVLGQATATIKTTFSNPPIDGSLVTGKSNSIQSSDVNTEVLHSDFVVPKPVEIAEVVWVHPQSELELYLVYKVGQYAELPRLGNFIGGGRNGEVCKCFVNILGKDQEVCLACKIEKKKPLYRNQKLFKEICTLNNGNHIVKIHAYLIVKRQPSKLHPYGYIGYLLMEYFPLGSITDNLKKFQQCKNREGLKTLYQLSQEIEEMECEMRKKENGTDDEFGKFRHQWCALKRQKDKVGVWCQYIIRGVIEAVRRLHNENLTHLDIKDHNFLLRKTCEHKEVFICECNEPSFDVLLGDFDYAQEIGSLVLNPKSTGTRGFKVPHMESIDERAAQPCHDLYSNMVTIIRVACKMSLGGNDICMEILRFWEALLLHSGNFEAQLSKLHYDLEIILSYIKKLENANHFDNENHRCNESCEFFKNEIAFCGRKLLMPPQHKLQYELTNQMMQFGSDALIMGYSSVFLTHGLSSLREDGVLSYMRNILTDTIEDCMHRQHSYMNDTDN